MEADVEGPWGMGGDVMHAEKVNVITARVIITCGRYPYWRLFIVLLLSRSDLYADYRSRPVVCKILQPLQILVNAMSNRLLYNIG
jgi:hypothetical protein